MTPTPSIAAVIIAKNEADRIGIALTSVQFCNEIIVIDSSSTDNTRSIAETMGATVIEQPFLGYGAQKNFGFSQSNSNWILSIDADEEVSAALAKEIVRVLGQNPKVNSFLIRRKNFFLGKELKYGKESNDFLIRLFKNGQGSYSDSQVHETMLVKGSPGKLENALFHYTYRNWEHAKGKLHKYAQLGAIELKKRKKRRHPLMIMISYPVYFIKHYLIYGNILNGFAGWKWSKLMASYHCQKYKELNKINH